MYIKTTKYIDFDGNQAMGTSYFRINKREALLINQRYEGDLAKYLEKSMSNGDTLNIVNVVEDIVLTAYGVRSEDGRTFIKNEEVRESYRQTLEFDALILELLEDPNAMILFTENAIYKDESKGTPSNVVEMSSKNRKKKKKRLSDLGTSNNGDE